MSQVIPVSESTSLVERFRRIRNHTERLCETLGPEDCGLQSMEDASPIRWHLAHTTWFFDAFVLAQLPHHKSPHPDYGVLFNSYYNSVGEPFPRAARGLLSRPTLVEVRSYRREIDEQIEEALVEEAVPPDSTMAYLLELGLQHEQQHQELMLTDIKHAFSLHPHLPVFRRGQFPTGERRAGTTWSEFEEGVRWIGHEGEAFCYDNELPRHREFLEDFALCDDLVTCGQYQEFMADGGYQRHELWLSDGWRSVNRDGWAAPLYWQKNDNNWFEFTLAGLVEVDPQRPVCSVSYYEADAFARWAGARLPTEAEWEVASRKVGVRGHFADERLEQGVAIHPSAPSDTDETPRQMFGEVWQWTASPYTAYPGYRAAEDAWGEYNGKFMCNQFVLRGGSCATPSDHVRRTYRNFFPPSARWQFSGIRLAR